MERNSNQFVQVPIALLELELNPLALKLYLVLLAHARQYESCQPSQAELASQLKASPRAVRNWLGELAQAGLIETDSRQKEGQPNCYHLKLRVGSPNLQPETAERNGIVRKPGVAPGTGLPEGRNRTALAVGRDMPEGLNELAGEVGMAELEGRQASSGEGRNEAAYKEHELIHADKRLHGAYPKTVSQADGCEKTYPTNLDNLENHLAVPSPLTRPRQELEQVLLEARVAGGIVPKLAQLARSRGRGVEELQQLTDWIQSQPWIKNPGAYLTRMVQLDQFEIGDPLVNQQTNFRNGTTGNFTRGRLTTDRSNSRATRNARSANQAQTGGIDWSKYRPGGKYGYLVAGR